MDFIKIEESWLNILQKEFNKGYFKILTDFVRKEYTKNPPVYPPGSLIFNAFNCCPFDKTKVVIIGQDPYHGENQANGLSFSVNHGIAIPPSLRNMYKELETDLDIKPPTSGDLTHWAKQGVLLLNATLTVRGNQPGSHQNKGWEEFTDAAIEALATKRSNIVFILWGSYAQKKGAFINKKKHLVLTAPHPSPLAAYRGFFGCKHFSKTNEYLIQNGKEPIEW